MPNNWKTYNLGEAPIQIIDGDRGKNYPKSSEFTESGYCLFLSAKNVTKRGFEFNERFFISQNRDSLLRKGKLNRLDLILTTRGTVGNVAFFNENVPFENIRINSGMVIIRPDTSLIDVKFLYLFLRSGNFKIQVLNNQTGSAQPQLPIRDLKRLEITLPPLPEQRAIASILTAIDDKIELNLQQNKTLEEMAMTLYKHWFVDFGPFQNEEFVESELGMIPKGWEVKSFGDVTKKITDGAHHSPKTFSSGKPMASVKDMTNWGFNISSCRVISETDYSKLEGQGCRP